MKCIVFDAGPIISLVSSNLLSTLEALKNRFGGEFYISSEVKRELVDKPLNTKKFEFEALLVLSHITRGILNVIDDGDISALSGKLLQIANNIFKARGSCIRIVHSGEMQALAVTITKGADVLVIDERTTRLLVEDPDRLLSILKKRLHTEVEVNKKNLKEFQRKTKKVKIIRSVELAAVAYELGYLNRYIPSLKDGSRKLIDGLLWGVKLNGCSVTKREIDIIIKSELGKHH